MRTANVLYPDNLYKGIFWLGNPDLMYLGMQDQYYTFTMFDTQAWYARDYVLGRISLPSHEEMAADIARWRGRLAKCAGPFDEIDFQANYLADLHKDVDYPGYDIDLTRAHFKEWLYLSPLFLTQDFATWQSMGGETTDVVANRLWKQLIERYEDPGIDDAIDAELRSYIERRKREPTEPED